jgi:hypothetical protein
MFIMHYTNDYTHLPAVFPVDGCTTAVNGAPVDCGPPSPLKLKPVVPLVEVARNNNIIHEISV